MFGGYAKFRKVAMLLGLCVQRTMVLSANMVAHNKIKRKEGSGHVTLTRCYNFYCDPFDLGVIAHVCNLN
jgi:hypothetical protein